MSSDHGHQVAQVGCTRLLNSCSGRFAIRLDLGSD